MGEKIHPRQAQSLKQGESRLLGSVANSPLRPHYHGLSSAVTSLQEMNKQDLPTLMCFCQLLAAGSVLAVPGTAKQFTPLAGQPVWVWLARAACWIAQLRRLILILPEKTASRKLSPDIAGELAEVKRASICIAGGPERPPDL